jgi:hypothetical protein
MLLLLLLLLLLLRAAAAAAAAAQMQCWWARGGVLTAQQSKHPLPAACTWTPAKQAPVKAAAVKPVNAAAVKPLPAKVAVFALTSACSIGTWVLQWMLCVAWPMKRDHKACPGDSYTSRAC